MTSPERKLDEEIIYLLSQDDWRSITLMYTTYERLLSRRVKQMIADHRDCEEIVQDVFIIIWERRKTLKPTIPLRGYLIRAASNRALNFIEQRDASKKIKLQPMGDEKQYASPSPTEDRRTSVNRIRRAVQKLPLRTRTAFQLSTSFNMTNNEIAIQMKISVKAVEKLITNAMRLLKNHLRCLSFL